MFKNYFKTAWRNLLKNKFYAVLNIAGLTVGLSVGIIILLWVQDERSFDGFHRQAAQIYRLQNQVGTGSSQQIWTATNSAIAPAGRQQLPEVLDAVRTSNNFFYSTYRSGDKIFAENKTYFVDPSFFSVFDFSLISGNAAKPFPDANSVVITATTARRYFGDQDPVGKVLMADDSVSMTVSGVIKDIPKNSNISGDMFFPMALMNKNVYRDKPGGTIDNEWEQFNFYTYLLLRPGTDIPALANKLRNIHLVHEPADTDIKYLLQQITETHLYRADGTDGGISTIRTFTIIALLILVIACINYVNLSTARAMLRVKEVSMRKIMGALRGQLFLQFITETALLFGFALVGSVVLIRCLLPVFNSIADKELIIRYNDYHIWRVILLAAIGTLVISSIYPAMLLSSFEPVKALKGKLKGGMKGVNFRKILVTGQFTISVALITGTIIISQQLKYIRSKDLGYDKTHVLALWMRDAGVHEEGIRNQLQGAAGVHAVTQGSGNIVWMGQQSGDNSWDGKLPDQTFMMHTLSVGKDFIPFFRLQLLQGNSFSGTAADSTHFILNETAVKQAGIINPIGKRFKLWETNGTIIGVVKDFHFNSLREKIQPAVFYVKPQRNNIVFIKTTTGDAGKAVAAAKKLWDTYNSGKPFSYNFLDDTFNALYRPEQQSSVLFNVFAGIAVFISCLGLLGLTAYTAQLRTREIGVRKVLGARVGGIVGLLSKDFLRLVVMAIIIAAPLSWFAMYKWLEAFAYRITISWTVFILSGLIAVTIALITISFQSVKAAMANPVKSLRSE